MTTTIRSQINEKLDWIIAGETLEEKVFRARAVSQMDPTFPNFIRMACIDEEQIVGLPEGIPEKVNAEDDLPDGIAFTTLRQEIRRVRNFRKGTEVQNLSAMKRENLWLQLLEGIHWKEQEILTQIKDRTLFYAYPELFDIMEALGAPVDIPRPVAGEEVENPKAENIEKEAPESASTHIPEPSTRRKGRPPKAKVESVAG